MDGSRTQLILEDSTPTAPTPQPIPTIVEEEEEDVLMLVEELFRYFLFPSVSSAFSPISKYLETMHEHLRGTFPTDPAVSTRLKKSLLRVAKLADCLIAPEVKEACQHLVVKLEKLAFNYRVYEECKSSALKSLNRLLGLRAQKESFKA